jgi:hypothetical protein
LLDRLQRLSFRAFRPLLLAAFVSKQPIEDINKLLIAAERYNFTLFSLSRRRANTGDSEFFSMARDLVTNNMSMHSVIATIDSWINSYYDPQRFMAYIVEKYELGLGGFFKWDGLRYFLYEHDQWLTARGKQSANKLAWSERKASKSDNITIEHIFPQTPDNTYWLQRFEHLDKEQTTLLANSLGNLVPLSRAKNSSLQNDGFDDKKNNGNGVGYYNGSASENEIAQYSEWVPDTVLARGLSLLNFMEQRWGINLGDEQFKTKLLHLDFLNQE